MRIIFFRDTPEFWIALAIVLVIVIGVVIYHVIRPPPVKKLLQDGRYHQALAVYAGNLPPGEPTWEDRHNAFAVAAEYLTNEHGIPAEQAEPNLRLVVAEYDREQSYELRHEAIAYERAGAHELALEYFERAARLQEGHDREDYEFLQRCVARVRRKVRPRKEPPLE
jgi:hypothetical protein